MEVKLTRWKCLLLALGAGMTLLPSMLMSDDERRDTGMMDIGNLRFPLDVGMVKWFKCGAEAEAAVVKRGYTSTLEFERFAFKVEEGTTLIRFVLLNCVLLALLLPTACKKREAATSPATKSKTSSPTTAPITDAQVPAKVIEIVAQQMGVRLSDIKPTTHLHRDLKMDELDDAELVMELEDTFGMSIADEDTQKYQTVQQVIDYVRAHRKTGQ